MWDMRGNNPPNSPRSPYPHFPVPFPRAPPEMNESRSAYQKSYMPFGTPIVPPARMHNTNPYSSYNTFPRSSPPRFESGVFPSHMGQRPYLRMPTPEPAPLAQLSREQHREHRTRTRARTKSNETRRVHYADNIPPGTSPPVKVPTTLNRDGSSQQLRRPATPVQPKQSNGGHRARAHSTGSAVPRPVLIHPAREQQVARGHQYFQYSKCTGRKKALCIGINYTGQKRQLRGCINDIRNVKRFLTTYRGYRDGDIVMLMDETTNPRQMPTRRNIIDAMRWLVKDAKPHDSLFFHYSGHGGQIPDHNGSETDGYDEVIYPVDYKTAGVIVDDEMNRIMVQSLPTGCRLTAIFDSCHSGTALDLPYIYHADGRLRGIQMSDRARAQKATSADAISFSACRDDQTSADTVQRGVAVGAMSYAFVTSLCEWQGLIRNQPGVLTACNNITARNPVQSYQELLRSVREILRRYEQKTQLSSSHPIDTNLRFIL
ncbi:caspase domain-containing protein [Pisolithus orientalis]|uniref:caspase domain-containing protein n=1 Tax=Pisolithus orientalis TaxID=936130 RepID=UPI0022256C8B|nr:caspase domain-containing protein [Pisolithus orientalis]KAI5997826.1 caspase domain-containing protein [Pisolithus orientalis]